jgi:hypothetical protein
MSTSDRTESIGRPATPLSQTLASIHSWQSSPGLNPQEILRTLDRLISERLWEGETGWDGRPMTLTRALAEPWPVGLGMTVDRLGRLYKLAEDAAVDRGLVRQVRDAIEKETPLREKAGAPPAGERNGDNVTIRRGNSESYLRRRLRRDRPDLLVRVDDGELSANAAAVEAGFRKPTASVPVDTADAAVRALLRRFDCTTLTDALARACVAGDA